MDHTDYDFIVGKFHKALFHRFHRSLYVRLDNDRKFLEIASLDLIEKIIQRKFALGLFQKTVLVLRDKGSGEVLGFLIACEGHQDLSCVGHVSKTEDLHGCGRPCFFYPASLIVHHGADLAAACACRDKVAHMKGSLLYKDSCHRAFALVKLRLDHKTSGRSVGIGFQLCHFRCKKDHLKEIVDALACMG